MIIHVNVTCLCSCLLFILSAFTESRDDFSLPLDVDHLISVSLSSGVFNHSIITMFLYKSFDIRQEDNTNARQGGRSCAGAQGPPKKRVWTGTKILSPNIRYFVAN